MRECEINALVHTFEEAVLASEAAWSRGDTPAGNRHASRSTRAFFELIIKFGDTGRDALARLLSHQEVYVRTTAAAYLLRYKHAEAMRVLKEAAASGGKGAFEAQQAIDRWNEKDWHLDPDGWQYIQLRLMCRFRHVRCTRPPIVSPRQRGVADAGLAEKMTENVASSGFNSLPSSKANSAKNLNGVQ